MALRENPTQSEVVKAVRELQQGGVTPSTSHELVITTQAEFEEFCNGVGDWETNRGTDAEYEYPYKSVLFIGDGGTLEFTRTDGYGISMPTTLTKIEGINKAKITISNASQQILRIIGSSSNTRRISGLIFNCSSIVRTSSLVGAVNIDDCEFNFDFTNSTASAFSATNINNTTINAINPTKPIITLNSSKQISNVIINVDTNTSLSGTKSIIYCLQPNQVYQTLNNIDVNINATLEDSATTLTLGGFYGGDYLNDCRVKYTSAGCLINAIPYANCTNCNSCTYILPNSSLLAGVSKWTNCTFVDPYTCTDAESFIKVQSVNGQTGEVVITASDLDAYTKNETDTILEGYALKDDLTNPLPIGTIISSAVVLNDAGLHLLDGSSIAISGVYAEFCTWLTEKYNADNSSVPTCTESEWQNEVNTFGQCGKFVIGSDYVRLPKIIKFIEGLSSLSDIGTSLGAGLPNITGTIEGRPHTSGSSTIGGALVASGGAFDFSIHGGSANDAGTAESGTSSKRDKVTLDASKSNSIYGNSDTVQPQATKYPYYIVVASTTKTDIQVNIDNIASDLNLKADNDANNIKVDDWKDKLGIHLYHHNFAISDVAWAQYGISLILPTSEKFTISTFAQWLYNKGYTAYNRSNENPTCLWIGGTNFGSGGAYGPQIAVYSSNGQNVTVSFGGNNAIPTANCTTIYSYSVRDIFNDVLA